MCFCNLDRMLRWVTIIIRNTKVIEVAFEWIVFGARNVSHAHWKAVWEECWIRVVILVKLIEDCRWFGRSWRCVGIGITCCEQSQEVWSERCSEWHLSDVSMLHSKATISIQEVSRDGRNRRKAVWRQTVISDTEWFHSSDAIGIQTSQEWHCDRGLRHTQIYAERRIDQREQTTAATVFSP